MVNGRLVGYGGVRVLGDRERDSLLSGRGRRWVLRLALLGLAAAALFALWAEVVLAAPASVVYRGPTERKQIALTFDGAYALKESLAVLRTLQRLETPATLFLIGNSLHSYPAISTEIVQGMVAGLFEVGDHTWSHPDLTKVSASTLAAEIGGGAGAFRKMTGARTVPLFRPPYGATNARVAEAAGRAGYRYLVMWTIDTLDWKGIPASTIANTVLNRAQNGAIVLMHLSATHTAAALPVIVNTLRSRGYELVTVSTLLKGNRLFLDVDASSPSGQAIARLVGLGILSGYDGNYFGPTDTITRAQVAKVATLVGGLPTQPPENAGSPSFADVPLLRDAQGRPLAYPFVFVEAAAAAGLVVGKPGPGDIQVFEPNQSITRVQLAQILARMARQLKGHGAAATGEGGGGASPTFADVPAYAAEDVALVASLGLMTGYTAQRFDPWSGAQRAHVALVMTRYLDLPAAAPSP